MYKELLAQTPCLVLPRNPYYDELLSPTNQTAAGDGLYLYKAAH